MSSTSAIKNTSPSGGAPASGPVCCILGASFGTRNLGVSALAASTVASLLHSFPNARIFLLDYGKTPASFPVRHDRGVADVELVNLRFSWKIFLRNNIARLIVTAFLLRLVPSKTLRERWLARNPSLRRILEAQLICSLAGGDSFSDIYGMRRFWYVTLPQILVLLLNKPLTILPQTLGPFKGTVAKSVAGFILRQADRVYTRDRESADEVRPLMRDRQSKLTFSYDMAFLLKPIPPAAPAGTLKSASGRPLVGLNVSGLLFHGGYTRNNMFGLKADYRNLMRRIVEYFIERQGADVLLVPHVFGAPGDLESDPAANAELYRELQGRYPGRLRLVAEEYDQHEIKYLIGQCEFFLGSRMHACIAALSQSVPAIGLAYSKKFLGVLRTIDAERLVADLRTQDEENILAQVEKLYIVRADLRAALAQKIPAVRDTVATLFARNDRSNGTSAAAPVSNLAINEC